MTREPLSSTSVNQPRGGLERRKVGLEQKIPPLQKSGWCLALQREGRQGEREENTILGYPHFGVTTLSRHLVTLCHPAWGTEELLVCGTRQGHGASHHCHPKGDTARLPYRSPFQESPFQESPFQGSPFQGSPFKGSPFQGSPFQGSPFQESPFQESPFRGSPFRGSPFQGCPFQGSHFQGSPFQGSPFQESPFQGSPFQGSLFQGSPFQGSPIQGSPFQGLPIQGSPFPAPQPFLSLGCFAITIQPLRRAAAFPAGSAAQPEPALYPPALHPSTLGAGVLPCLDPRHGAEAAGGSSAACRAFPANCF